MDSLSICAHDHILSRKLLDRVSGTTGSIVAIAGDWLDFERISDYDLCPTGHSGEGYETGERPTEKLVELVCEFLTKTEGAVVVCENWAAKREDIPRWPCPPPRISCLGETEVYHILTSGTNDLAAIEEAVVPWHHWQTGICSTCPSFPNGDIPDEEFLDDIVRDTDKIFVPAFDNTGYLVWTISGENPVSAVTPPFGRHPNA